MASDPSLTGQPKTVRLGKYTVVDAIGSGGMGTIFRAHDPETGRDFALKMLTPEMAAKPAMRERFRREAAHAASLHHENIVKSYELFEYNGKFFIPMEFVDGIDLAHHIEAHTRLDPEETREIMIQACRALKHAHDRGIVHRDIKPSNFLLSNKSGRQVVKLTDFGLARDPDREAQLTTEGTTVGTVNYISPEQARDSGLADIRSDLYSLGCTWYHMLTGQPPFPDGGIAERIVKHLEEEPPDVRQFNPRVSKALVTMLNKLLAKKPRARYQTPAELLNDLHSLTAVKLPKEAGRSHSFADERDEEGSAPTRRAAAKRKNKGKRRGDDTLANKSDTIVMRLPRRWLWIGTALIVGALLLGAVILVVAWKWSHGTAPDNSPAPPDRVGRNDTLAPPNNDPRIKADLIVKPNPDGKPAPLPSLLTPKASPIEVAALRERLDAAFPKEESPNKDTLRIQRTTGGATTTFSTLADALAQAAPERPVTIEIQDNGPLFWSTTLLRGRDVTLCAAKGYRPLIVWDMEKTIRERDKTLARPFTFLTVEGGRLLLEGVDVVLQWPEKFQDPLTLVQATNADFSARRCTFSLSGEHSHPVVVTRFVATKAAPRRCRFSDCALRGNCLQALDLNAPGGLVFFENCLVAGGDFPLFQVRGGGQPAAVFAVRSTLVAASSLLHLQGAQPADTSPSLNWLGWDSILSRSNEKVGGEMIVLPPGATAAHINWESYNTLYAGWQTLLTGAEPIPLDASSTWRRVMRWPSGDRAIADVWPPPQLDLSEAPAALFRTAKTPLAFAASVNNLEAVGCIHDQLPPLRDNWKALAYERFVVPSFNILEDAAAPDIPRANGKLFTGQALDVSTEDLGLFLQKMQSTRGFGPKVVMLLKGTGAQPMSPVKLKGVHLTLHFEQPPDDARHLSLTLSSTADVPLPAALVEIEDGGLDVVNGVFALPDGPNKAVPASLFKVSGGDLRLYRCRLSGPHLTMPPANYRGLIQFEGSGSLDGQKGRQCVINESVLVSERAAMLLHGVGTRLLVKQSVLIAGGAALQVEMGTAFKGRANVKVVLSSSSIAARQCVLQVEDAAALEPTMEPIVLQSMQCAFQAPFRNANPGVIRYSGDALAHGLFVWQSDADLFDKRFQFGCLPVNHDPPKPAGEWQTAWLHLFGTYAATRMRVEPLTRQFDVTRGWAVHQLQLPPIWSPDNNPPVYGADLIGKALVKKPKRP